jgi:hypothetical protein
MGAGGALKLLEAVPKPKGFKSRSYIIKQLHVYVQTIKKSSILKTIIEIVFSDIIFFCVHHSWNGV